MNSLSLNPGAVPASPGAGADAAAMFAVVGAYAAAKSRQDIDAALAVCDEDFLLYTDAFGTTAPGHAQRAADYLARHDAALRPAGSRFAPVTQADDLRDLQAAMDTTLQRCQRMVEDAA